MIVSDYIKTLMLEVYCLDGLHPVCITRMKIKNKCYYTRYHYLNSRFECHHSDDSICINYENI